MRPNLLFWNAFYWIYSSILNFFYCRNALKPLGYVDLTKYVGLWYEVARKPNSFELSQNTATAEYTQKIDSQNIPYISVNNTSYNPDGTVYDIAMGEAYINNPSTTMTSSSGSNPTGMSGNSELYVHFTTSLKSAISFFQGQYWILDFNSDPINGYAIVGESTRTYFWILSRSKTLNHVILSSLLSKIKNQYQYNTSNVIIHNP
jgi:apolipoprotein D and lipocalin family protein